MSEVQSPFSGGGSGGGSSAQSQEMKDLMSIFGRLSIQKYVVDPNGSKIEMEFNASTGKMTLKSGDTTLTYDYVKV